MSNFKFDTKTRVSFNWNRIVEHFNELRVNEIIETIYKYNSYHQNTFNTKYIASLKYIDSEVVNRKLVN